MKQRFRLLATEVGCIACRIEGDHRNEDRRGTPADIHHITAGGRRLGDRATIPLCPWHHRGIPADGLTATETAHALGPSYARTPAQFHNRYGSDTALLSRADAALCAVLRDSGADAGGTN